jgi:tetratricopeptide (TPR) repeat protein
VDPVSPVATVSKSILKSATASPQSPPQNLSPATTTSTTTSSTTTVAASSASLCGKPKKKVSFAEKPLVKEAPLSSRPSLSSQRPPLAIRQRSAPASLPSAPTTLTALQNALRDCQKRYGDNHAVTAMAHNNLGNYYYRKLELDRALASYRAAAHASQRGLHTADALANLGTVLWSKGDLPQALDTLKQALVMYSRLPARQAPRDAQSLMANVYHQMGLVYSLLGDGIKAVSALQQALWLRERFGTAGSVAKTLHALGQVCCQAKEYANAVLWYTRALQVDKKVSTLENLCWVYCQLGDRYSTLNVLYDLLQERKRLYAVALLQWLPTRKQAAVAVCQTMKNMLILLDHDEQLAMDAKRYRNELTCLAEREGIAPEDLGLERF